MTEALKDKIYHSLFTADPDALLIMDVAGNIVSSNPSAQMLFGYSGEGLRGLPLKSLIPECHRDEGSQELVDDTGNPGRSRTNDGRALQVRHRDGSELIVEVNLTPTEYGLVLATIRDTTESRRVAEAMREYQAQRDLTEEMAHLGSWELNFASKRLTWSNEVYRMFGLRPQAFDATYEAFLERVHPDDRAAVDNAYSDSLRGNRDTYEIEHRIIRKDNGETRFVHEKCRHVRDSAGRLVRSVGIVHDITERRRAADALEESEARFRATFEQAAVGIAHVGLDGRWLRVNRKLCEIVGYSQEEMLSSKFQDITHPEDLVADLDYVRRMLAHELDTYSMEKRYLSRDGGVVWINLTVSLVWKTDDTPDYFISVVEDIRARKAAEAALRESEEKLKLFIEHAPAALVMLDRDMRHIAVSRRWMEDLSLGEQNIIGRLHYEIMPEVPERFRIAHQRGLAGEVVECDADRFERQDGSVQWGRWAVRPWHASDGAVGGIVIFAEDITELKRYEQEFRSLAESSPDSIMRYDREGRILYLNQKLSRDFGLTEAELIGRTTGEVWPDSRYADIEQAVVRAIETGTEATVELSHPLATGGSIISQIRVVADRDASGRIVGALAFGRDITAIREAEQRLTYFIENLPGMAYVLRQSSDGHLCFPFASAGIEEIYGLRPEDVKDDIAPLRNLSHADDRPRIKAAVEESARTMTPFRIEFRICRPGLSERWVDVRADPVRQADGDILWYGIMLDITERKRSQVALQAMNAEMEQMMRFHVASQTTAAITHELNQPLSAIGSYAEAALRLLRADNPRPDKLRHALQQSVEQARRAGQVMRELLAFMNNGEVPVESVDLNEVARRVLERVKADHPGDFEGWLELEPGSPRVSANSMQVEKVLTNLMENSLDAMRDGAAGKRLITITVCRRDEEMGQVTVRDSGPGINEQNLRRIFDPFFTTKPKGLGMGLAISRAMIMANGGQLWAESEPTSGACFHFTLPLKS